MSSRMWHPGQQARGKPPFPRLKANSTVRLVDIASRLFSYQIPLCIRRSHLCCSDRSRFGKCRCHFGQAPSKIHRSTIALTESSGGLRCSQPCFNQADCAESRPPEHLLRHAPVLLQGLREGEIDSSPLEAGSVLTIAGAWPLRLT
jgi:hypothetical protein